MRRGFETPSRQQARRAHEAAAHAKAAGRDPAREHRSLHQRRGSQRLPAQGHASGPEGPLFEYRGAQGQQRKITFDRSKSVAEARKLANAALVQVQNGENPQAERDRPSTTPTLARAFELFEGEHVPTECRPVTAHEYHRMFHKYVLDEIKQRLLCHVTRRDMVELMRSMRTTPVQANNIVKMLSAFFNWCAGDGALLAAGTNPTLGVRRNPDRKRSFVFEGAQLYRFSRTLDEAEKTEWPFAVAAVRLLLMAGMREQEGLRVALAQG